MTHQELTQKVEPIIDQMNANEFSYLVIAGKEGTQMEYVRGNKNDLHAMLFSLAATNDDFFFILKSIVNKLTDLGE